MSTLSTPPIDPAALDAELRERLAAAVAATVARREARRQLRAVQAARRTAGLRRRHATKLARPQHHPQETDQ